MYPFMCNVSDIAMLSERAICLSEQLVVYGQGTLIFGVYMEQGTTHVIDSKVGHPASVANGWYCYDIDCATSATSTATSTATSSATSLCGVGMVRERMVVGVRDRPHCSKR